MGNLEVVDVSYNIFKFMYITRVQELNLTRCLLAIMMMEVIDMQ
jgi:hypothetical protein